MQSFPTDESVVRVEVMSEHMTKFHLGNNKVLHRFTSPDSGHPHDHPFDFTTSILKGGYIEDEYIPKADGTHEVVRHVRLPNTTHEVKAGTIHLLVELLDGECLTLMQPGEKEREPGFYDFSRPDGIYQRRWFEKEWRPLSA